MRRAIFACFAIVLFLTACNKESTVGADLLGDETIDVTFTDSIEITAQTIKGDPVITYRNSAIFNNRTYLIGQLNDPVFGKTEAITYFTPTLSNTQFSFPAMAIIDSVVMSLPLDTLGQYGDTSEIHLIDLFQLQEPFIIPDGRDTLMSDFCDLNLEGTAFKTISSSVKEREVLRIYNPTVDSNIVVTPQLRMRLDDVSDIWEKISKDTLLNATDELLLDTLNGFAIRSNALNSMFGIRLNSEAPAYIEWYYQDTASVKRLYLMNLGELRHSCFTHDYTGTEVGQSFDQASLEKNYTQSMAGVITEYDLSNVLDLPDDELINDAVLEIFIEDSADEFYPIENLSVTYTSDNGNNVVIEDLFIAQDLAAGVFYGGSLSSAVVNGVTLNKYDFKITSHVINLVRGVVTNPKIKISAVPKPQRPSRSVLYSPLHPEYPAKLKLILSNP